MQIITINLPVKYIEAIELLRDFGVYPSKSEFIRRALRDFLTNELTLNDDLSKFNQYIEEAAKNG